MVIDVIIEYLRTNRRLVVPDFGAFVVKESGEVLFSELLRSDDGVLRSLLIKSGMNEMESAVVIDRFIFEIRNELNNYGYCRLDELGTLRLEPETQTLKLYPPVCEEVKVESTPYIPKPIVAEEKPIVAQSQESPARGGDNAQPAETKVVREKRERRVVAKPQRKRKAMDAVMIVAIAIMLLAIGAICYGMYVSSINEVEDEAAMDALRVVPEQTN